MLLEIDGGGYLSACDALYDGNHAVADDVLVAAGGAQGGAAMAGGDTSGRTWADQYDPAADRALQAGAALVDAYAHLANLTNASLVNHRAADGGAMISGGPAAVDTGDYETDHYGTSLGIPSLSSAAGGTGDTPGWWHWIASHMQGWFWPDADTGRLRSVGETWKKAADGLRFDAVFPEEAAAALLVETSPEISTARRAMDRLQQHTNDLAAAYDAIGNACIQYAQDVDDKHQEIEDELKSFLEWTVAIEAGGFALSFVTFGAAEGGAQVAEGAEAANAASKVIRILEELLELARAAATVVGDVLARIGEIAGDLGRFLTGAEEAVEVEEAGVEAARAVAARGSWTRVSESMSDEAKAYQEQITGHPWDESYVVDGVKFDGFDGGSLLDAKGPNYDHFLTRDGEFQPWWRGRQDLVDQATRQLQAADGAPVTWHVADQQVAHAMEDLLEENGITTIHITYSAPK